MDPNLIALKILALLHDPPYKPILSAAKSAKDYGKLIRCVIDDKRCKEVYGDNWDKLKEILDEHEQLSLYILSELIYGLRRSGDEAKKDLASKILNYINKYKDIIFKFDATASSIDRSILSKLYGETFINQVIFKHPIDLSEEDFTGRIRDTLLYDREGVLRTKEFKEAINRYVELIFKIVNNAKKGFEYILLWRSIIPIFIYSVERAYSRDDLAWIARLPADTRAPISTLIDHLYATASLSTVGEDEYIGLIYWEVSGKQRFISEARIPRDLWAGSYLISLLTLYVCIKLSNELGPDSIFKPLLLRIPLYDKYIKFVNEGKGKFIIEDRDLIPLIPGAVLAIIPGSKAKEYVNKVLEWYRKGWNEIIKVVMHEVFKEDILKEFEETIDELKSIGIEDIDSELYIRKEVLNRERNQPPFDISISYIRVPWKLNERRSLLAKLVSEDILDQEDMRNINSLYEVAEKLEHEESKRSGGFKYEFYEWPHLVKAVTHLQRASSRTKVYTSDLNIIDIGDRRKWCNICWRREAVIRIPRLETAEKRETVELISKILKKLRKKYIIIKDGEALCLYCLVKRVLFNADIISSVIKNLLFADYPLIMVDVQGDLKNRRYPSTEDIAISPLIYSLASLLSKKSFKMLSENNIKNIYNSLYNLCKIYSSALEAIPFEPQIRVESLVKTRSADAIFGELERKLKDLNGDIIRTILMSYPLILYNEHYIRSRGVLEARGFNVDTCIKLINELNELLSKKYEDLRNCIKQFNILELAEILVRADGRVVGSASLWTTDYLLLVKADGDNMGDMLSASGKYRKTLTELIPNLLMDKIQTHYKGSGEFLNIAWSPSISYGYMISRALAMISIEICNLIRDRGGVTIFSGGDDIMAMLPLLNGLKIVAKCREFYSMRILKVEDDFLKNYGVDSVRYEVYGLGSAASQSSSITIFDAFYPLKKIIEYTMDSIEEKAKKVRYLTGEKDTIYLTYYPRSGLIVEAYVPLGLVNINEVIDFIIKLALAATVGSGEHGLVSSSRGLEIIKGFSSRVLRANYNLGEDVGWSLFKLVARRAKVDEKMIEQLNRYRIYVIETPGDKSTLANQILKASLCISNGLRGSKPLVIGDEL